MPWKESQPYGVFRKILIPNDQCQKEAEILAVPLAQLQAQWKEQTLSSARTTFELVMLYMTQRKGRRAFLSTGRPLPSPEDRISFLEEVRFFGLPDTIRKTLLQWEKGDWNLVLTDHHPTSWEMLETQSHGLRFCTIDFESAKKGRWVEGKRDAFEHLLHDLAHAFMFFREDYEPQGQIAFFREMKKDYPQYSKALERNELFREKWEYCISDMNSHPAHLQTYWQAIRKEAGV